jgi:hypothetical protein
MLGLIQAASYERLPSQPGVRFNLPSVPIQRARQSASDERHAGQRDAPAVEALQQLSRPLQPPFYNAPCANPI